MRAFRPDDLRINILSELKTAWREKPVDYQKIKELRLKLNMVTYLLEHPEIKLKKGLSRVPKKSK